MAHISMVTLGVDDLERSATFYEELGWQRSSASVEGSVVFLRGGPVVLGLFGRGPLAEDASVDTLPPAPGPTTLATNQASRESVDAELERARTAGATITKEAEEVFWGGYSGYFQDPDGHLWEVAYNPLATVDGAGVMSFPEDA